MTEALAVASAMLRELGEPSRRGDRIKAVIARVAKMAGLSYWRAFDLWYGKARRIEGYELDAIKDALDAKRREDARREIQDIRTRLMRIESSLAISDADFHRETISQIGAQIRRPR